MAAMRILFHLCWKPLAILWLQTGGSLAQGTCLGLGFTQTIPAKQEWSKYSTTVLKPGDAVLYSSLGFACNGTVHSLTIPSEVRGNISRYANRNLSVLVSVWRVNDTGHYRVREFRCWEVITSEDHIYRVLRENSTIQRTIKILTEIKVLAKDILGFELLSTDSVGFDSITVIRHLPLLFKPGPSPSAFIPIVSASFTASSGPVSDEADSTQPSAKDGIFGIIAALCQVEVVVVAIVTGLIVHFVTKIYFNQKPILSQDRNGNSAELGPATADNGAVYEPVGLGGSTGDELVEMQPSPAYQAVSKPDYL